MLTTGTQKIAGTFNYFWDSKDLGTTVAVNMAYSIDLNGDGIEEVIFSGFETQPNLAATYSNTQIAVFGWENGEFKNLTEKFLPGENSRIEGSGSLSFGDFNNDGKIDIFASAFTDMDFPTNSYQFLNTDQGFIKENLGIAVGQHDSAAADINADGFVDIVAVGYGAGPRLYLGGPDGLTQHFAKEFMGGSGVALGDFLGNGTVSMVLVDHIASQGKDTALYRFKTDASGNTDIEFISSLPTPRFDLPLYDLPAYGDISDPWGHSHDIRAIPFDFDSDGRLDTIVISRPTFDGNTWPLYTEVQFLKNLGAGSFSDVTEQILESYIKESAPSYAPQLGDFNGDGLTDLFLSESSWESTAYNSTTILVQQPDGTFIDSYRNQLSGLVENYGGKAAIAKGPNGSYYLITEMQADRGNTTVKIAPLYFDGKINGTDQADILPGSVGNDQIAGRAGNDKLTGLDGDDTFDGGAGNDKLDGGRGSDTAGYADALSGVSINLKIKQAQSLIDNDLAGIGIDMLKNIENVTGSNFDDKLVGSKLANQLDGSDGNDTLDGGLGADILSGGSGADRFFFGTKISSYNIDTITDFVAGEDQIQLSGKIFSTLKAASDFLSVGTEANSPTSFLVYDISSGTLSYDADGNGIRQAVKIAFIGQGLALTESDFLVE